MLKGFVRRLIFPHTYSSQAYIKYLRKKGIKIGDGTRVWSPNHTFIDETRPYLITIGRYCKITRGVTILAHDYSRSVLRRAYGENTGEAKETTIGDNVFLGNNCIILMGASIGDNCIVGAGAVVTKKFPDNVVIGGNPAKIICTLDEYLLKRKLEVVNEAKLYATMIWKRTGKLPTISQMGNAFAWLYLPRTNNSIKQYQNFFRLSGDDEQDVISNFLNSEPIYQSFEEFLRDCDFNIL